MIGILLRFFRMRRKGKVRVLFSFEVEPVERVQAVFTEKGIEYVEAKDRKPIKIQIV
jgi:hypothetical protein